VSIIYPKAYRCILSRVSCSQSSYQLDWEPLASHSQGSRSKQISKESLISNLVPTCSYILFLQIWIQELDGLRAPNALLSRILCLDRKHAEPPFFSQPSSAIFIKYQAYVAFLILLESISAHSHSHHHPPPPKSLLPSPPPPPPPPP